MFAAPILATLFMYGKFSEADVIAASPCLIAFISGLPAYVLLKVFSSTFFALKILCDHPLRVGLPWL
jgi:putative peptidoglycan lipid II flippase